MNSKLKCYLFAAVLFSFSQAACTPDERDQNPCGDEGVSVQLTDQEVCAYKQAIVIETGFSCPAAYPNRQDIGDFTVCSQRVGGLEPREIDVVRDVLINERMWRLEPPVITVVNPPVGDPINQDKVDILWVLDNSSSMCEEQDVLRQNLDQFINPLLGQDFHIGLTTTHAPEGAGVIEPIAREAMLQNTPQPVPGPLTKCLRDANGFAPLRQSLDVATGCLADPGIAAQFVWTDLQIDCALQSPMQQEQSGCVSSSGLTDRIQDGNYNIFDLFPDTSEYRALPKVFRRVDYEQGGIVDAARLRDDLRCAMTVGTRGDGYEKGLRAAIKAVSPEHTGGAVGLASSDMSAPNHGLIREDARFGLVIISDENDCSHDSSIMELGNACGANICEYMNSEQTEAAGRSALISPEVFADDLVSNLSAVKGAQFDRANIFVATITGTAKRYDQPFPTCSSNRPDIMPSCSSGLGDAFSGDRYERFANQFVNHYPNTVGADEYEPLGWMCTDTFAPALAAIGSGLSR
jgi:hypothetical protein